MLIHYRMGNIDVAYKFHYRILNITLELTCIIKIETIDVEEKKHPIKKREKIRSVCS